ncbi:MAG: hypothetical protein DRP78_02740 [Candidatus Omnitrophota bacterium]|nr:MAG: hypothetical protein DRP78_02740 [Candidatus Omnitrophota bacterium]
MPFKKPILLFFLILLPIIISIFLWQNNCLCSANFPSLTAKSAIIFDLKKNSIIYQKNAHLKLPAASTAKILTAIIVVEKLDLNSMIKISKRASGITPSKAYFSRNAKYKVRDLLKAMLISSANDAGVALAEAVSGTEIKFALLMNKKAKALGAKNSFFLNATGLPERNKRQYSTAYDLSLFMKKLSACPELIRIMRIKKTMVKGTDGKKFYLKNHNKFLWKECTDLIGKTGYTTKAHHCFLGMFTAHKHKMIVAIQGSNKLWADLERLTKI